MTVSPISQNPAHYRKRIQIGRLQTQCQPNTTQQSTVERLIMHAVNKHLLRRYPGIVDVRRETYNARTTLFKPVPSHTQLEVLVKVAGLGAASAQYHALLCARIQEGPQGAERFKVIATSAFTHIFRGAVAPGLGMPEGLRDVLMGLVDGGQTDDEDEE